MTDPEARLGGRLPLLDPDALTPAQKTLRDDIDAMMGRWANEVGFRSKTREGRLIGPFNPVFRSPEIGRSFLQLQADEAEHTSLNERVRQVVILSVGAVWQVPYELYAHAAAARLAGFSDAAVAALSAGAASDELAPEEDVARRLALSLSRENVVGDALYADGLHRFGETGLVDLVILAGCYDTVCGLLNTFAVPAPEDGRRPEEG